MSSYECGVCGWAGRMPWGRECPQCHPKTDQQITFQVLAGRRDEEAIAAAKRYVRGLEAQVQADEEAERSLRARYNDLLVDHARLAAQVLRVRELRDRFATHEKSISYQAAATLLTRALDGDGPGCQGTPDKTESVVHAYEADTWRAPRLSTIGDDGGDA